MKSDSRPRLTTTLSGIPHLAAITGLFFVSGAVALVYETIWQRQFALVFGSAAPATAAVLAAYFAGLGLGAWVVGRWAGQWTRPLRSYAALEACVGAGALLVTPLLGVFDAAYPWVVATFPGQSGLLVARTLAAFVVLFLPTFCMGGTLPVLGFFVDRQQHRLGITAGRLYVVNTTGAGLGALLVPFWCLPRLGIANTIWLCAALNGLLALCAWWLDRRSSPVDSAVNRAPSKAEAEPVRARGIASPFLLFAFISGVVTFAMQVLWNRAFAQIHENSMYSFAVIVAVVILALAAGGQCARRALARGWDPARLIGGAWLVAGLGIIAGPWWFVTLTHGLRYLPTGGGWSGDALHLLRVALAVLLAPVLLLGIAVPAIMEQAGRNAGESTPRILGRVLSVNVVGAVVGALVGGFAFPILWGKWGAILWLGICVTGCGLWLCAAGLGARGKIAIGSMVTLTCVGAAFAVGRVNLPRVKLATDGSENLLALHEGAHGITAVVGREQARRIKLNNFYGLGGTLATADERMQAHVPLLLHPAPKRVAFLGLGTGITAGAALFHPVEQVTVMELVPDVVDVAKKFFDQANQHLLTDPRTRVVADDARHHLRSSGEQFDVIVGDLVVPWRQGEGSLFTLEQFRAARGALAPGGLYCQWLPLFQLSEQELNILIRTFLTEFPRAELWRGDFWPDEPAIALIGGRDGVNFDVAAVEQRVATMRPDPANPHLGSAEVIWMHRVGVITMADLAAGDTRINTEDRPWVELLGPLLHAGGNKAELFTGRRLQNWLVKIREKTRQRAGMLPPTEEAGMRAGAVFEQLTLCLSEDDRDGTAAAEQQLREILPEDSLRQLMSR
jgi:spermidine synthase